MAAIAIRGEEYVMPEHDLYSIEARSLRVAGVAGHNYWVLRGPDGTALAELHGLATDRETGRSIPIGTDAAKHSLRIHHLVHDRTLADEWGVAATRETYVADGQPKRTVLSAGREEVMARWGAAVAAREPLNALDLDYPPYGFRVFGQTVNSNSAYRTLGEVMSVPVDDFRGRIEPGVDNRMTTSEHIERLRTHGYPQTEPQGRRSANLDMPQGAGPAQIRIAEMLDAASRGSEDELRALSRSLAQSPQGQAWLEGGRESLERRQAQGMAASDATLGHGPADREPVARGA